jgi:hypothetical protein
MTVLTIGTLVLEKGTKSDDLGWLEQDRCGWLVSQDGWMLNDGKAEAPGLFVQSSILAHADTEDFWREGATSRTWDAYSLWKALVDDAKDNDEETNKANEERWWQSLWREYRLAIHPYLTKLLIPNPTLITPSTPEYRIKIVLDAGIPAETCEDKKVLRPGMTLLLP